MNNQSTDSSLSTATEVKCSRLNFTDNTRTLSPNEYLLYANVSNVKDGDEPAASLAVLSDSSIKKATYSTWCTLNNRKYLDCCRIAFFVQDTLMRQKCWTLTSHFATFYEVRLVNLLQISFFSVWFIMWSPAALLLLHSITSTKWFLPFLPSNKLSPPPPLHLLFCTLCDIHNLSQHLTGDVQIHSGATVSDRKVRIYTTEAESDRRSFLNL